MCVTATGDVIDVCLTVPFMDSFAFVECLALFGAF